MRAVRLKVNDRTDPLGIDDRSIRFTWNCEGGMTQTAYQIVTENWDSGRVDGPDMNGKEGRGGSR